MTKTFSMHLASKVVFFILLLAGASASCTTILFEPRSTPRSTPAPGQLRFTPEPASWLQVEFDYPETWILNHYDEPEINLYSIRVFELTRVTPTPGCCARLDEGIIWLDEIPVENPEDSIERKIQAIYSLQKKVGLDGLFADKNLLDILIEESTITVDGKMARRIVNIVVRKSPDGSIKRTRTEEIYLPAKGKYYCFSLVIPNERRNDTFGKAFDDLIASIKFVP